MDVPDPARHREGCATPWLRTSTASRSGRDERFRGTRPPGMLALGVSPPRFSSAGQPKPRPMRGCTATTPAAAATTATSCAGRTHPDKASTSTTRSEQHGHQPSVTSTPGREAPSYAPRGSRCTSTRRRLMPRIGGDHLRRLRKAGVASLTAGAPGQPQASPRVLRRGRAQAPAAHRAEASGPCCGRRRKHC